MARPDPHGSFDEIREEVDGRPMLSLFRYATPYWAPLALGVVSTMVNRVARLFPALLIAAAIDLAVNPSGTASSVLSAVGIVPAEPVPLDDTAARLDLLYYLGALAAGAYVVQSVSHFGSRYFFQTTAQRIQHDLRLDTYDHMQRLSLDFFNNHQTGGMMSILNSDINRLEDFFNAEIREITRAIMIFTLVGGWMIYTAPWLGFLVLVPVPIIALITAKFIIWIEPKYKRIRELVARMNTRLSNNLGGAAIVKSFDRYDVERDRVAEQSGGYRDEKIDAITVRKAFFASLRLLVGAMFVTILVLGGRDAVTAGGLTAGAFVTYFMFLRYLDGPMTRIGKTANNYQKAKSSAERVFGVLGYTADVTTAEDGHAPDSVDGRVAFDDVDFSYAEGGEQILDGVDLEVEAGETVGFAGTSGSGKSTLLKLPPRFYDVDSGAVRIDGTDVREFDLQTLRNRIGVVEQDPYMFSGTIRENVAYGDAELFRSVLANYDDIPAEVDRRVREAAEAAGAHEFVTDLPDGYDTMVGERGVKLSGGQRQRVSIARTLLNDPDVIILDEATSDVDTETEELIQRNLEALTADRTAFVIAHRLSTIQDADRIVVMDDGEVIETGTHEELVDEGGAYAGLWASQTDENAAKSPVGADD
ncbi:ABC transporter ATP-binding protein [Halosimplex halophilum]|uniref:ABC transporter ATP-binding protein n=1 Tax=Halosimplex halophilum TaxID=2559572 RepID=UPI00107EF954|nr:ABC transporter ATP-binding protein [Halosimplex halophilum]